MVWHSKQVLLLHSLEACRAARELRDGVRDLLPRTKLDALKQHLGLLPRLLHLALLDARRFSVGGVQM